MGREGREKEEEGKGRGGREKGERGG